MTDDRNPRSGRVHIEAMRLCDRCGDPYVGNKGCRATLYESACVPKPEVDRSAETKDVCAYCHGTGVCPGCNGEPYVDREVKSKQLAHPLDEAALSTRRKPTP